MASDDRAIVVGINHYPVLGENGENKDLEGPENDARAFCEWLMLPTGGALDKSAVITVASANSPQDGPTPTTATIDKAFESIIDQAEQGQHGGRRLYLFFAGHGFASSSEDVNLLMANATRRRTGHHIAGRKYVEWFRAAALFKEIVLFMDCCREIQQTMPVRPVPWNATSNPPPSRVFIAYATGFAMASRERPSRADPAGAVRGRFTEALITGLQTGVDDQGRVTAKSLRNFVTNALGAESQAENENANTKQTPEFPVGADDDFVFAAQGQGFELVVTFQPGETPTLLDGTLGVIAPTESHATRAVWRGLRPGLFKLQTSAASKLIEVSGSGGTQHETV